MAYPTNEFILKSKIGRPKRDRFRIELLMGFKIFNSLSITQYKATRDIELESIGRL